MPMERLEFKNRFVATLEQELTTFAEGSCETPNPLAIDQDTQTILIECSWQEWRKVFSSLFTGADICYPDESDSVRWVVLRNLECPVSFCAKMIECLLEDEDTKEALATTIAASPEIRRALQAAPSLGAPMSETQLSLPLTPSEGCDKDVVFAEVTQIVDQMNTNNVDFLQIMSAASTPGKRLAQVIKAIPVLETLPVDDVVEYVAKMYDEIVTQYDAQWTTALRDELRCGLFCIAKDNPDCELTYQDMFDFYNERLSNAVDPGNLVASVVQYTILGTWSGSVVVDIMMLNQVAIWRAASDWLGVSLRTLQTVSALGANFPDSDWEILCTDCPVPLENCLAFAIDEQGVLPAFTNSAQYTSGAGWAQEIAGGMSLKFLDADIPAEITSIDITWYRSWEGGTANPDYDKYYGQIDSPGSSAGTVYWGQGADPLRTGNKLHIDAPPGTHWDRDTMIITNIGGGNTWPQNAPQSTGPQYMLEICFNN